MERWKTKSIATYNPDVHQIQVLNEKGNIVCEMESPYEQENINYAHRIVTCVNACEGINPKAIPEMIQFLNRITRSESSDAVKHTATQLLLKLVELK